MLKEYSVNIILLLYYITNYVYSDYTIKVKRPEQFKSYVRIAIKGRLLILIQ